MHRWAVRIAVKSAATDKRVRVDIAMQATGEDMHDTLRRGATLIGLVAAAGLAMAQDASLARNLAATCANCHGTNGQARGDMKPLAGVSAEKIVAMLADFKGGAQPATIMHQISKGYTDEQIKLMAAYFAAQPARK
jgi:sulfide dehydrogenase cytochrome subunit